MLKKYTNIVLQICIVDILFLFGAYTSNVIIRAVAACIMLIIILGNKVIDAMYFVIALSFSQGMLVLSDNGTSLIGFAYLIIFIRIVLNNRNKITINNKIFIPGIFLLMVGLYHVIRYGTVYDFAIGVEFLIVVYVYISIFKLYSKEALINIYNYSILGTFLLIFNTLFSMIGHRGERIGGFLDNPNYLAITFVIMALSCVINYCYKVEIYKNIVYFFIFTLFILLTGSRAAALALIFALLWIICIGFFRYKKARNLIVVICIGIAAFYLLLILKVPVITDIYNNLVLRTLEKLGNSNAGQFMDISSGRLTLWEYYIDKMSYEDITTWLGKCSDLYYLRMNNGYGLLAHNIFIGAIMGIGLIGLGSCILIYIGFFRNICNRVRGNDKIFWGFPIAIIVGYFFVDGIVDLRITLYIVLSVVLKLRMESFVK